MNPIRIQPNTIGQKKKKKKKIRPAGCQCFTRIKWSWLWRMHSCGDCIDTGPRMQLNLWTGQKTRDNLKLNVITSTQSAHFLGSEFWLCFQTVTQEESEKLQI